MQHKRNHERLHLARRNFGDHEAVVIGRPLPVPEDTPSLVVVKRDATIAERAATTTSCGPGDNSDRCQRPVSDGSGTTTLPIILGAAIPVVAAIVVLLYLHRRNKKKLRLEDKMDKTKSMDFGMGVPNSRSGSSSRSGGIGADGEEKPGHKKQFSMDMDLGAPYLLPPELNNSHDSLHSLSRAYHSNEDRYRPATALSAHGANPASPGSANASIRSFPHSHQVPRRGNRDSSLYTASIRQGDDDYTTDSPTADLINNPAKISQSSPPPPRMASLPNSGAAGGHKEPLPVALHSNETPESRNKTSQGFLFANHPEERDSYIDQDSGDLRRSHLHLAAHIGVGDTDDAGKSNANARIPPSDSDDRSPYGTQELHGKSVASGQPHATFGGELAIELPASFPDQSPSHASKPVHDHNVHDSAFFVTPPSPKEAPGTSDFTLPELAVNETLPTNHRESKQRYPSVMGGLEVNPHDSYDMRRLSMGFRPLPPAPDPNDSPEERAMRIRSFYKEYFDDSNQNPNNPNEQPIQMPYQEDYYDDYYGDYYQENDNEHGEPRRSFFADDSAPVFDEQTGQFMMAGQQRPFAEPPFRRAMTPPPRMPPPFQRPPIHGSSAQFSQPPHPRSYSSASGRYGGPYTSGRGPPPPRRPVKPAEPLHILPSPHLLKEDSFASPIGFAPAPRVREYQSGTASETGSMRGGVRPYSPAVPAHIPLASSFDDLNVLPTPHQLRKSGTFTGLDFAPPRRFGAAVDNMSDTGSIRSNRTGMSNTYGIRSGAYRVSRLPPEVVPTRDDMVTNLRPTWDMRSPGA